MGGVCVGEAARLGEKFGRVRSVRRLNCLFWTGDSLDLDNDKKWEMLDYAFINSATYKWSLPLDSP